MRYRYGINHVDMVMYHIDMVILDIDIGSYLVTLLDSPTDVEQRGGVCVFHDKAVTAHDDHVGAILRAGHLLPGAYTRSR